MENKNLNDIVIEDADSSKKAQFKNILTLLALLFIILVISIVITKLILGNDDENSDLNYIKTESTVEGTSETNASSNASTLAVAGVAAAGAALATTAALSSSETKAPALTERNTSSRKKLTLRDHRSSDNEAEKKPTTTKKTYTRPKYVAPKERTNTNVKKRYTSTAPAARTPIKASRGYYIKVGTFKDTSTAIGKIKELKLNYKEIKTKEGATRVLIGPFYSRKDAQNHLTKAKASISPDAYITKIK